MQSPYTGKANTVTIALIHRYGKANDDAGAIDTATLAEMLRDLPDDALAGDAASLLTAIAQYHPDCSLAVAHRAILASVDDCIKLIFNLMDLEPEVVALLRRAVPEIARALLMAPDLPLGGQASILTLLDRLVEAMTGWSANLGRPGEQIYSKASDVITALCGGQADLAHLDADLAAFVEREQRRLGKLEERLAASETGLMRSHHARALAAQMLNDAMAGQRLTADIVTFLQGAWYDSLQLLLLNRGADSSEWSRAVKLTETIIWTYQPIDDGDDAHDKRQRLYRIIENLPGEIRELLVALEHDTRAAEIALDDIQSDHVTIVSGQQPDYVTFEAIAGDSASAAKPRVSRLLLRKVDALTQGQWFIHELDDTRTRIKLILKADDVRQLLLVNRNGVKALQTGFDEFAYYLSSGRVKPLVQDVLFSSTFRTYYEGLIEEHGRQTRLVAERRARFEDEQEAREAAHRKALTEAAAAAKANEDAAREQRAEQRRQQLARAAAEAAKPENAEAVALVADKVSELAIGASLRLPAENGGLEDCTLAVRVSAADRLIFVSHAGARMGEYTSRQLVELLVAGDAELQADGVEFEDTLAAVVTRLRQDRSKSYDDLTRS